MANPFVTVRRVETALHITNQGARNLIRDAQARGWLDPVHVRGRGRGRRQYWLARQVFEIIDAPPLYERRRSVDLGLTNSASDSTAGGASRRP